MWSGTRHHADVVQRNTTNEQVDEVPVNQGSEEGQPGSLFRQGTAETLHAEQMAARRRMALLHDPGHRQHQHVPGLHQVDVARRQVLLQLGVDGQQEIGEPLGAVFRLLVAQARLDARRQLYAAERLAEKIIHAGMKQVEPSHHPAYGRRT